MNVGSTDSEAGVVVASLSAAARYGFSSVSGELVGSVRGAEMWRIPEIRGLVQLKYDRVGEYTTYVSPPGWTCTLRP